MNFTDKITKYKEKIGKIWKKNFSFGVVSIYFERVVKHGLAKGIFIES